jgi:hypothetical protein
MSIQTSKKPITIKHDNYFGLSHERVSEKFEGSPKYVGYVSIEGRPYAAYHSENPNRQKGHKDFILLTYGSEQGWVIGMDSEEMKKHSKHSGILCLECGTALYSLHRHHYHDCGCPNKASVDGGLDYLHCGAMDMKKVAFGTIDVLHQKFYRKRRPKSPALKPAQKKAQKSGVRKKAVRARSAPK